jgi:hypothetical protein
MEKRIHGALTLSTMAAILFAGTLPARDHEKNERENQQCSNATLHGSYGLHATGTIINVGPFAAVGVFTFDGNGNLSATLTQKVNGNVVPITITGTYTVAPDCTVSDVWNLSSGGMTQHESVIVDNGKEYVILNTTPGNVVSGVARKQFTND